MHSGDLIGLLLTSFSNEVESVDSELLGNSLLDPHHLQSRQVSLQKIYFALHTIPAEYRKNCFDVTWLPWKNKFKAS